MTTTTDRTEAATRSPTTMPIGDIAVHPQYRRQDIGKLRDLQQSIRTNGLHRPIPVTADGTLIAGERRLRACKNLGWTSMPVNVADNDAHAVELLTKEQADTSPHCKPRTATELALLGLYIEDLERAGADERKIAGQHRQHADGGPRQSRDVASDILGWSRHYYIQVRAIALASLGWETTPGGYERVKVEPEWAAQSRTALELIDKVWAGEAIANELPNGRRMRLTVNAVYTEWNAERIRRHGEVQPTSYSTNTPAPVVTQRAQREALTKGVSSLNGLCYALSSITDIDPSVTREEAASFERDLSNASRVLRGLHNKIKEYAHGNA